MHRSRRIAAAATASTLAVAGAITGFALTAGTAKADTLLGNCQITSANATPQSCAVTVNGFTTFAVDTPQTMTLSGSVGTTGDDVTASWTSKCFDNNNQPLNSGQSGSFEYKATTVLIFATQVDSQDMSAAPAYCDVTAKLTANTAIAGTDTAKLALTVTYQTATAAPTASPTPSPTPSSTSTQPSGGGGLTGIVQGFGGKCLDDLTNSSKQRATVAIWRCNSHDRAQSWTYAGGELKHNGLCLNAKGNAKNGSKLILWSCNAAPNEIWVFNTINHQVLLKAHGYSECVNDPGYSTKNGTQLIVWSCVNTPNEH